MVKLMKQGDPTGQERVLFFNETKLLLNMWGESRTLIVLFDGQSFLTWE
jgi:hypothetical protein